jgi:hypothetical protein
VGEERKAATKVRRETTEEIHTSTEERWLWKKIFEQWRMRKSHVHVAWMRCKRLMSTFIATKCWRGNG